MVAVAKNRTVWFVIILVALLVMEQLGLLLVGSGQIAHANSSWGTALYSGSKWNGVDVFSNGDSYVSPSSGRYGYPYQCVELVQRFYAIEWGYPEMWVWPKVPNSVRSAYQMFQEGYHPSDFIATPNGGTPGPQWGDALVFAQTPGWPNGHVAIVTSMSGGRIYFVEQNVGSRPNLTAIGWDSLPIDPKNLISNSDAQNFPGRPPVQGWLHSPKNSSTPRPPTPTTIPSPTPSKVIIPGGAWISPDNGSTITTTSIHLAARAYPTNPGDPPIDHVNFTVWWPALGPKDGPWKVACVATPLKTGDVFGCDADLAKLGAPAGPVSASFDVYDQAGNQNLSPNGEHSLVYQPPTTLVTRVIVVHPVADQGQVLTGFCWTGSLSTAGLSSNAWRCTAGNSIQDPCFSSPDQATSVICGPLDPSSGARGTRMNLTKPLPARPAALGSSQTPWVFELADGTRCTVYGHPTGTLSPSDLVAKELIDYTCSDGWVISRGLGDFQKGQLWTIKKILPSKAGSSVLKSVQVGLKTVWLYP